MLQCIRALAIWSGLVLANQSYNQWVVKLARNDRITFIYKSEVALAWDENHERWDSEIHWYVSMQIYVVCSCICVCVNFLSFSFSYFSHFDPLPFVGFVLGSFTFFFVSWEARPSLAHERLVPCCSPLGLRSDKTPICLKHLHFLWSPSESVLNIFRLHIDILVFFGRGTFWSSNMAWQKITNFYFDDGIQSGCELGITPSQPCSIY